jgi:putative membrane protein
MAPASGTVERSTDDNPSPQAMKPAAETLTDAQIAAITDAANGAEVAQAKLALQKSKNARVKKFAQMMIDEHGKAQRDQAELVSRLGIKPETDAPKVSSLKTDAADSERTLKAATADSFDRAYMDIQVADHQMVLDFLDRDFIPSAKNAEFKRSLQDFRPKVEHHLQEAMDIQQSLSAASKSGTNKSGTSGSSGSNKSGTSGTNRGSSNGTNGTGSSGSSSPSGSSGTGQSGTNSGSGTSPNTK